VINKKLELMITDIMMNVTVLPNTEIKIPAIRGKTRGIIFPAPEMPVYIALFSLSEISIKTPLAAIL
jgi:hypothetical protein